MPWDKNSDAARHTHRAKSSKQRRQWRHVANSILERTGDEARAVRGANSVIKRGGKKRKPARAHVRHNRRRSASRSSR